MVKAVRALFSFLAVSALLFGILLPFGFSSPAYAATNGLTTGAMTTTTTISSIGVEVTYTGDANANANATLAYRLNGTSTWFNGLPMEKEFGTQTFAGSVIGLSANTTYDLAVTFADPDGVVGTNPVTGNATTQNGTFALGTVHTYYVSPTGNDSLSGTSVGNAWKTIQRAADTVVAGDTVYVEPGTYYEAVSIDDKQGASGNYITFIAADITKKPIIDGSNATIAANSGGNIWTHLSGNIYYTTFTSNPAIVCNGTVPLFHYWDTTDWTNRLAGITGGYYWDGNATLYVDLGGTNPNSVTVYVDNHSGGDSWNDSGFRVFRSDYIRIAYLEIEHFYSGILSNYNTGSDAKSDYCVMEYNDIHDNFWNIRTASGSGLPASSYQVIRYNTLHDSVSMAWATSAGWTSCETEQNGNLNINAAINIDASGRGSTIANNTIYNSWDGIDVGDCEAPRQGRDIDVLNNTINNYIDDGIEAVATDINVRLGSNFVSNAMESGISLAPSIEGPVYVYNNTIKDIQGYFFKLGSAGGQTDNGYKLVYNNTCYTTSYSGSPLYDGPSLVSSSAVSYNFVSKNNVFRCGKYAIWSGSGTYGGYSFNYDNIWSIDGTQLVKWNNAAYPTIQSVRGNLSWETNGINVADCKFVDPANGNFSLQSSSPLIDTGVVIPGINDAGSEFAYSGSAPDIGAFEFASTSPLQADFSANSTEMVVGQSVQFTNGSTGDVAPLSYQWDFDNNGTWDSTAQNPTYSYSASGNYTVTLKVTDAAGNTNTKTKTGYVAVYNRGDANKDGNINSLDITKVERIIAGLDSPTPGADANGDGNINALDLTRIESIILGS